MDDLISRQAAISAVMDKENHDVDYHDAEFAFNDALIVATNAISDVPSAQRKGHWIDGLVEHVSSKEKRKVRRCSECGSGYFIYDLSIGVYRGEPNYCPNCGADMRGEENADI